MKLGEQNVNLHEELNLIKSKKPFDILHEAKKILEEDESLEAKIIAEINAEKPKPEFSIADIHALDQTRIFSLDQIKDLCLTYRLKFVDAHRYNNDIPKETILKIKNEEKDLNAKFKGLKIIAPKKTLQLGDCDGDPLLFASLANGTYYLLDKWGNDLNAWRKILAWPVKNIENWLKFVLAFTVLLTLITPSSWISTNPNGINWMEIAYYGIYLFVSFNIIALFAGLSFHQNFSEYEWDKNSFN